MTWEELCEKYGAEDDIFHVKICGNKELVLFEDGTVWIKWSEHLDNVALTMATDRKPDEMDAIIELLKDRENDGATS
jgi:hypothetical protein